MMRRALCLLGVLCACVGPQDDASQVIDLRVIGINFEPPELMAPDCRALLAGAADGGMGNPADALAVFGRPVTMRWLILDPKGEGREIDYEVRTCANQGDLRCMNEGDFKVLTSGKTTAGVLEHTLIPAATVLDDGNFLLAETLEQDDYKGLGGIRLPVVLHLRAGTEELYAQKLMVYSCAFFPSMKANVTPQLKSFTVRGEPWPEDVVKTIALDDGPVRIEADDVSDRYEPYTVPSFKLEPVNLVESWRIAWHTDNGRMSPVQTGGTDLIGNVSLQQTEWLPRADAGEGEVGFYMVVRDGRGGESWVSRRAHLIPATDAGR